MGAGLGLEIVRNLPTHRIWTLPVHVSEELRKLDSISDKIDLSGKRCQHRSTSATRQSRQAVRHSQRRMRRGQDIGLQVRGAKLPRLSLPHPLKFSGLFSWPLRTHNSRTVTNIFELAYMPHDACHVPIRNLFPCSCGYYEPLVR